MKDLGNLGRDLAVARQNLQTLSDNLPRIIGVEAVKIVKQNFQLEAYDSGAGITKWPKRKNATNKAYSVNRGKGGTSSYKGSTYNKSNPLLRQTQTLFNSIRYVVSGRQVFIGVNLNVVPYAKVHNEGDTISQKARTAVVHFSSNKKFSTLKKANYAQKAKIAAHSFKMPKRQYMPLPGQPANPKIVGVVKRRIKYEQGKAMRLFKK